MGDGESPAVGDVWVGSEDNGVARGVCAPKSWSLSLRIHFEAAEKAIRGRRAMRGLGNLNMGVTCVAAGSLII